MAHIPRQLSLPLPLPLALAALLGAVFGPSLAPAGASADDDAPIHQQRNARARHDYRRFSDGPRRVPRPRGNAKERADTLGLGSLASARQLLGRSPEASWVEAAPGEETERLLWPVEGGRFGRGFGFVRRTRPDLRHDGVDVAAPEGAVVRAVADGLVAYSDNGIRGFGNCVMILHGNGWVSIYAHHYRNTVQPGWRVARGERIGFVGATGIARGPHLHFELRHNGRPMDPRRLFDGMPDRTDPRAEPSPAAFAPADLAAPRSTSADRRHNARAFETGSRRTAMSLLRHAPPADAVEAAEGRVFRNLLWPLRGGDAPGDAPRRRRHVTLGAGAGTAVRAAADAVVVYVGDGLPSRGTAVVLLHKNGWVTLYGSLSEIAVESGQSIRRGEWLGFVATDRGLRFELVDGGRPRDPRPLFVGIPGQG